jgi:hypothetical protein
MKNILYLSNNLEPVYGGSERGLEQFLKLENYEHTYLGSNPLHYQIFSKNNKKAYKDNAGFEPVTIINVLLLPIIYSSWSKTIFIVLQNI